MNDVCLCVLSAGATKYAKSKPSETGGETDKGTTVSGERAPAVPAERSAAATEAVSAAHGSYCTRVQRRTETAR